MKVLRETPSYERETKTNSILFSSAVSLMLSPEQLSNTVLIFEGYHGRHYNLGGFIK